jgi:hypothetical protein
MANSYIEYTGNGLNDTFLIPFPFLRDFHINAQIDEVDVSGFSVVGTFVEFDTAPDNDAVVKIFRVTPRDGVITQYTDGGTPTAKDLLEASLQALYISQEIEDGTLSGSSVIANNSLTLNKIQQITSQHLLGRKSSLTGNVEQLSVADAKTMLGIKDTGTTAGTIAAGDDSRITGAVQSAGRGLAKSGTSLYWKPNVVQGKKTDTFTGTSTIFADITNLSATITPQSSTSKILVRAVLSVSCGGNNERVGFRLLRNVPVSGSVVSGGDAAGSRRQCHATLRDGMTADDSFTPKTVVMEWLDEPNSTSAITYQVAYAILSGTSTPTLYVNRGDGDTDASSTPRTVSTITLTEIPV